MVQNIYRKENKTSTSIVIGETESKILAWWLHMCYKMIAYKKESQSNAKLKIKQSFCFIIKTMLWADLHRLLDFFKILLIDINVQIFFAKSLSNPGIISAGYWDAKMLVNLVNY